MGRYCGDNGATGATGGWRGPLGAGDVCHSSTVNCTYLLLFFGTLLNDPIS